MDVSSSDAVRREYDRLAGDYVRRWGRYVARTNAATLDRLAPRADERLIDIGCGTGALLAQLAEHGPRARLAGVDLSLAMLAVARASLPRDVALLAARAERLPFADASFDAAASCSVFHFVPEPEAALAEWRRVVRPGGRIAITDWCHDHLTCRLLDLWLRLRRDPAHYRTYRAAELASMLEAAGWAEVRARRYRLDWWWGAMTLTATRPR